MEDYRVRLQGLILNYEERQLPQRDIRAIQELCEADEPLSISNPLLFLLDIDQVTVESWNFRRNSDDGISWQRYEIEMRSDVDFELEIE
ncbi:MAG: hypothetical protein HC834_10195 [Rhodospirillales bacterium]|nr:hypothetical protein [Rhodospirillales bacterium]